MIQFDTKDTLHETLKHLTDMVAQAVSKYRPRVISLQKGFNYFYQSDKNVFKRAGEPINGPTGRHMSELAKTFNIYLIGGVAETDNGKLYSTALVFSPTGELVARHRKVTVRKNGFSRYFPTILKRQKFLIHFCCFNCICRLGQFV